mmetsp:Transcript_26304/g.60589  ORF Transcript_26304/g.60589 Transcript_26304/m.60589 type:complete len:123 (+) Transcript_26304:2323-2691(+)
MSLSGLATTSLNKDSRLFFRTAPRIDPNGDNDRSGDSDLATVANVDLPFPLPRFSGHRYRLPPQPVGRHVAIHRGRAASVIHPSAACAAAGAKVSAVTSERSRLLALALRGSAATSNPRTTR